MKLKPRVFLSHSKTDLRFIQQLANDLRVARVDVWFDDWEIPIGGSIRRAIFEEGLPSCDAFMVYITESSLKSYWVQKELDAAIIQASNNNERLLIFADSKATRSAMPLDLQSVYCPILNKEDYASNLAIIASVATQRSLEKKHSLAVYEFEKRILEIEKAKFELDKQLVTSSKFIDFDYFEKFLSDELHDIEGTDISELTVFTTLIDDLANGLVDGSEYTTAVKRLGIELEYSPWRSQKNILSKSIILGLVKVIQPQGEADDHIKKYLTEMGRQFYLKKIAKEV